MGSIYKHKLLTTGLVSLAFLVFGSISACFDVAGNSGPKSNEIVAVTPTSDHQVIKMERGYIKPSGWEMPSSGNLSPGEKGTVKQKTQEGNLLVVEYDLRKAESELLTTEPKVILHDPAAMIRIASITELSFNSRVFAYSFVAEKVKKAEKSQRYVQDGPGLVYLYVDEDGDGIFELLKIDSSQFFVPAWVYE